MDEITRNIITIEFAAILSRGRQVNKFTLDIIICFVVSILVADSSTDVHYFMSILLWFPSYHLKQHLFYISRFWRSINHIWHVEFLVHQPMWSIAP